MPSAGVKCGVNTAALDCCEFNLQRLGRYGSCRTNLLISLYYMLSYVNMYLYLTVPKLILS